MNITQKIKELQDELDECMATAPTKAQLKAIQEARAQYQTKAAKLVELFMCKELSIWKDEKLKLQI